MIDFFNTEINNAWTKVFQIHPFLNFVATLALDSEEVKDNKYKTNYRHLKLIFA
jgi:hypothetical protein